MQTINSLDRRLGLSRGPAAKAIVERAFGTVRKKFDEESQYGIYTVNGAERIYGKRNLLSYNRLPKDETIKINLRSEQKTDGTLLSRMLVTEYQVNKQKLSVVMIDNIEEKKFHATSRLHWKEFPGTFDLIHYFLVLRAILDFAASEPDLSEIRRSYEGYKQLFKSFVGRPFYQTHVRQGPRFK